MLRNMKNKQPFKTLLNITEKTKELSNEGYSFLKKTPKYKLLAGTAMLFIPGSFTTVTTYKLGRRIISSYKKFKSDENNKEVSFMKWFSDKSQHKVKRNIHKIKNIRLKKSEGVSDISHENKPESSSKKCKM